MLDALDDLRVRELVLFDRIVALGTITAAAQDLGVPKATASRWLGQLEERVGSPLLLRSHRQLVLTERGKAVHQLLPGLLSSLRALRAVALSDQPGGTLRVSVPVPFGRLVGGTVIARFQQRLPGVRLEVLLQNERADLLRERLDLAIRGGPMPDSSLIARRLAVLDLWLYVSARYRDTDLAQVPFIAAPGDEARFRRERPALVPASVLVDDRTAVRDALLAGAGAGVLPALLGEPHRAEGLLIRPDPAPVTSVPVHAVSLPEQQKDPRLRVLIEIIREEMQAWQGA
ncbi:MAG: DNA-binding transcriptional LysR family regulator [Myxococcota bacterium]|jgi:DNA-binding transcriptional LysR family regulator